MSLTNALFVWLVEAEKILLLRKLSESPYRASLGHSSDVWVRDMDLERGKQVLVIWSLQRL